MQVMMDDVEYKNVVMEFQEEKAKKKGLLSATKSEIWPLMPSTV